MDKGMDKSYSFDEFVDIIRVLRSKDGCPWDREQTHVSLKQCLIEECYEVIEAINNKDSENLCEELGDVLLQVVMHSVIAEEKNEFRIEDVIREGGFVETKQVNKVKEPSRRAWNRMDNNEQEQMEKKIKESGKTTEYRLVTKPGTFYTTTKAEYDYAVNLLSQKDK